MSHVQLSTQFGLVDVAVRQRAEGDWYACLDTSHPQLRHLPGAVGDNEAHAVAGLLRLVEQTERGSWSSPPPAQEDCVACEPAVRVRIALAHQSVVGFAVAHTAALVWVVWEQGRGAPTAAWVPVASVSELSTGRAWSARHRRPAAGPDARYEARGTPLQERA